MPLVAQRMKQEELYDEMAKTPSKKFFSMAAHDQPEPPQMPTLHEVVDHDEQLRIESAALKIQYVVRKWLFRKSNATHWTRALLQHHISEERAAHLQYDVETWQYRNKVQTLNHDELMKLSQNAQFKFARYNQSVMRRRIAMHKTKATIGKTQAITSLLLEDAPSLETYDSSVDHAKFHALPLHIATKARLEHNNAMMRLNQPRIRKILSDFG